MTKPKTTKPKPTPRRKETIKATIKRFNKMTAAELEAASSALVQTLIKKERREPSDNGAAGSIVNNPQTFIDDGVDYSLPLPLPQNLLGDDLLRFEANVLKASNPAAAQAKFDQAVAITEARAKHIKKFIEADQIYHNQFDKPYLYYENMSLFATSDPLREWDWQGGTGIGGGGARKDILSRCHLAYERNPIANTAVQLTTRFSIGEGLTITYKNEDVEEVLEAFRNNPDNAVDEYEKAFLNDLQVDGEVLVRFVTDSDGQTLIYPLKPWEVWWIQRDKFIQRRIESYHWVAGLTDGLPGSYELHIEDIPAEEVHFVAINRASYEVRGRPELFRILPWLKAHKDWLEGRARQNHWRGAILWDVSLEGATPVQVATKRSQYRQPPSPGSLAIHNEKETWKVNESHVGAADVAEDGRQIKMMSAIGAELPEYMLSDGANANLASATAQQLPALRKFTDFQDIVVNQIWNPIYRRVLENAIKEGILPEEVEEQDSDGDTIYEDPEPDETLADDMSPFAPHPLAPTPYNSDTSNNKINPLSAEAFYKGLEAVSSPSPYLTPANMARPLGPIGDGLVDPGTGIVNAPPPAIPPKPKGKPKMIKTLDAFDLKAPEIETTDPKNLADALTVAKNNGWLDDETATGELGYDYRKVQKNLKREKAEAIAQGYQGGPVVPGQPPVQPTDFSTQDPTGDSNAPQNGNPNGTSPVPDPNSRVQK